jgi:purine-nucleoside phosphorylase
MTTAGNQAIKAGRFVMSIFERVQTVGYFLRGYFDLPDDWNPEEAVGVVLGSGLGDWVDSLKGVVKVPFAEIPGFPQTNVDGHAGYFCFVMINSLPVFIMQGRVHYYEGHPMEDVVLGVRVMAKCLGVTHLIVTNAAGGINPLFAPGDLVLISDHINFLPNPLIGANNSHLGVRFPDMTEAYNSRWRMDVSYLFSHTGVYLATSGPSYETPAEIQAFKRLGADLVGMSTVVEVIAARHAGIKRILGISLVTNLAAGLGYAELSHEEVKATADQAKEHFGKVLTTLVTGPLL